MASFVITGLDQTTEILAAGEVGVISSSGVLLATSNNAVHMSGGASLVNQGLVRADFRGVYVTAAGSNVSNSGTLIGNLSGLEVSVFGAPSNFRLYNSGLIQGMTDGSDGVLIQNGGNFITNSGQIIGTLDDAIQINDSIGSGGLTNRILNTGLIATMSASDLALNMSFDVDVIINSGEIIGNVSLETNHDRYDGRLGRITGAVLGEAGNDVLLGGAGEETLNGGLDDDLLNGGAGNDLLVDDAGDNTLTGGAGDDVITGGTGIDLINGGLDDDDLSGGDGNDIVNGGRGNDLVNGVFGDDLLRGQDGDDTLLGGGGNDTITGGGGLDRINGGSGADVMSGGADADIFVFSAANHSTAAASDSLTDFAQGEDLIDLVAVSAQVLQFRGTGAHLGGGTASLRFSTAVAGETLVFVDADGNGTAEMRFVLEGTHVLTAGDFLL